MANRRTSSAPPAPEMQARLAEFDREIAIRQLIDVGQAIASTASHLFRIGAISEAEFTEYRSRTKTAEQIPAERSTRFIRSEAEGLIPMRLELESRLTAARAIVEERARAAAVVEVSETTPAPRKRAARRT